MLVRRIGLLACDDPAGFTTVPMAVSALCLQLGDRGRGNGVAGMAFCSADRKLARGYAAASLR